MAELVSDAPGAAEKSKETFEPPMSLAQSVFRHGRNPTPASEKEILDLVTQRQMAPYYARVCAAFGISKDENLYAKMADANAAEIAALAAKKEDAEANQGDMEVLDALFDAARISNVRRPTYHRVCAMAWSCHATDVELPASPRLTG